MGTRRPTAFTRAVGCSPVTFARRAAPERSRGAKAAALAAGLPGHAVVGRVREGGLARALQAHGERVRRVSTMTSTRSRALARTRRTEERSKCTRPGAAVAGMRCSRSYRAALPALSRKTRLRAPPSIAAIHFLRGQTTSIFDHTWRSVSNCFFFYIRMPAIRRRAIRSNAAERSLRLTTISPVSLARAPPTRSCLPPTRCEASRIRQSCAAARLPLSWIDVFASTLRTTACGGGLR